jgi:hypothetical protein
MEKTTASSREIDRTGVVLYRFAQVILAIWLLYKFVILLPEFPTHGVAGTVGAYLGGNLFDFRTVLLVVGLLLLRQKINRRAK